jgi:hypothetical protein
MARKRAEKGRSTSGRRGVPALDRPEDPEHVVAPFHAELVKRLSTRN